LGLYRLYHLVTLSVRSKMRKFVSIDSSHHFMGNFVSSGILWEVSSLGNGTNHWKTCINSFFVPPTMAPSRSLAIAATTASRTALAAAARTNPGMSHWSLRQEMLADAKKLPRYVHRRTGQPRFAPGKRTGPAFRPTGKRWSETARAGAHNMDRTSRGDPSE
jgi:hypothetical protein